MQHRVPVLLPYPFPGPFDYRVPPGLEPKPGDVVLVPLNRREEVGVVWDAPADEAVPAHKLKPIVGVLETPPMRRIPAAAGRLDRGLHAVAAGRGDGDGAAGRLPRAVSGRS